MQLDVYNTQSSGAEKGGYIDQQAYGLSVAPTWKNHTLKFGLQKIDGDEFFDFVGESNAINLPNIALSNYNGPNEKSYQVNYMADLAAYGLPGLKTSIWYIKGWGIDATHYKGGSNGMYADFKNQDNENHYEVGTLASYTLQSGNFRGASVIGGYVWHRSSQLQLENNIEEFRLIINVPFKIL
ncbi:Porin D precursor [compost metagenome]